MGTFENIIGYEREKKQLEEIADMVTNPQKYADMGARLPRGLLLHVEPGVGKTLMATALAKCLGWKTFTLRRDKGDENFIAEIRETFEAAAMCAPSIVILDDMDKFAMTEEGEFDSDKKEYVAVQSAIDEVGDAKVFVIATVNEIRAFPSSLLRAGRFDRVMKIRLPRASESREIIGKYLEGKKVAPDVNPDKIAMVLEGYSAAVLEGVLNWAAIFAGRRDAAEIGMDDIIEACMRVAYETEPHDGYDAFSGFDDDDDEPEDEEEETSEPVEIIALHEAGHTVAAKLLKGGGIRFVTLRKSARGPTACL